MASAAAALLAEGNSFNPAGFAAAQRQQEQNIGLTAAQAARQQAEIPLVQQQVQHAALENQLVRQSIQDNRTLQQAYANHAGDSDYWKDPSNEADFEQELIRGGISYPGLAGYRTQALKWRQDLQGLDKGRLAIEDDLNQRTTDLLQGFKNVADAQKPQMWAQVYAPALSRLHPGQQFDPNNPLVGDALDGVIGAVAHHKQLLEEARTVQETKTSGATQAETEARTESEKLKTQIEQAELAHFKTLMGTPQALENYVEENIPRAKYQQLHDATVSQARQQTTMKDVNAVVEKNAAIAREQEKTKSLDTDPDILAARRKQEEALANYHNSLEQGNEANKQYYESAVGFHTTQAAAKTIEKVVELAQSKNPLAAQQLKAIVPEFTNAMQDIKRLGGMQNDRGFTSAFDTTMDTASSIFKGQPFTGSTLQQIMPYVRTITNGAARKHNSTVDTVNETYKKNYQKEPIPYQDIANPAAPAQTRKVGDRVTLKGGKTVTITKIYPDGGFDY